MSDGITLKIDDKLLKDYLKKIEKKGTTLEPLLSKIKVIGLQSVEENFESQGRPKWEPLKLQTLKRRAKKGYTGGILQRTACAWELMYSQENIPARAAQYIRCCNVPGVPWVFISAFVDLMLFLVLYEFVGFNTENWIRGFAAFKPIMAEAVCTVIWTAIPG